MKNILLLILVFFAATRSASGEGLAGPVTADVTRVVDGDALAVRAWIWVDQAIEVKVRLADVDAPELHNPRCEAERAPARAARDRLQDLAGDEVQLADIRHGKYAGRVVARIVTLDGVDIGPDLIDDGLAIPYGADKPWCAAG